VPDGKEPVLWPIEFRRPVHAALHQISETQKDGLEWIVSNIENGFVLMQGEGFALAWLCCTNPMRDSSRESSVVAGLHEQTYTPNLQDQKLASLQ
jgi:hypothetical protein